MKDRVKFLRLFFNLLPLKDEVGERSRKIERKRRQRDRSEGTELKTESVKRQSQKELESESESPRYEKRAKVGPNLFEDIPNGRF